MDYTGCQVFVVEDDDAVRDSLVLLLQSIYKNVNDYASGTLFLENHVLQQRNCLVLDLHLQDMSGLKVLQELMARGLRIPSVLMSALVNPSLHVFAREYGTLAVLEKPLDHAMLLSSIDQALEITRPPRLR
jgi:two-component system response regulator FixJ